MMNDGVERKVNDAMAALARNLLIDYRIQLDRIQVHWIYAGPNAAVDRSIESVEISLRVLPAK